MNVEPYWPGLFAKLFEKKNIADLISNVGAGEAFLDCIVCNEAALKREKSALRLIGLIDELGSAEGQKGQQHFNSCQWQQPCLLVM